MKFFNIQTIKRIFNSKNFLLWFSVALISCFIWLFIAKKVHNPKGKETYLLGVDVQREIRATENLVYKGVMDFGIRDSMFRVPEAHDYTFRMPGFIVLYLPLFLLFGKHLALTLIIIIEVLLHALSAYLLGKTTLILFKKNWTFYFCFFAYLACSFVFQFNFGFNREGLSTSVLVIAVYLIFNWFINRKIRTLFFYCVLMTWLIFLRPFFLPVFLFFNFLIIFNIRKDSFLSILKISATIFLPLLFALSIWTVRNYKLTKRFIVLESNWDYFNPYDFENNFQDFNIAIGGNMIYWQNNTSGTWFFPKKMLNEWGLDEPSDNVIPDWIFSDVLTKDTLIKSRALFWESLNTSEPHEKQKLLVGSVIILKKFINHIEHDYPMKFYVTNRLKTLWTFVYYPQGISLRGLRYPFNVILTFSDNFIKYLIFLIGFFGSFYFLFKIRNDFLLWFPLSVIGFLYIFLTLYLQDPECRRIAGAFPFLLVIACGILTRVQKMKIKYKATIYVLLFLLLTTLSVHQTITMINW